LNIVFVNPEYPSRSGHDHGGIATYIYSMANALAKEGNTVHILAKSRTMPDLLQPGIRFHQFEHTPVRRLFPSLDKLMHNDSVWERGYSLAAKELILRLHADEAVDCVEIPEYNGLACEFTSPLPFPVVVHFHTPTYLIDSYNQKKVTGRQKQWYALEAKALSRAHGFRCPSNSLKKEACRHYGIDETLVSVIPHPLDTTAFDAIRRSDAKKDVVDILFSGRLERRKGGEILLHDVSRILALDPRIQITLAGELEMGESGSYRNGIERSLSEKQRHRIWLLGPAKRCDLPVLYRRSDIFLMPSLFENAPYALLEAMASRLPVVAADTSGITELIHNNENGLLFNLNKQDSLLDCIKAVLASPQKAAGYAQKAYENVTALCAPQKIARQSMEYYSTVVASFKARTSAGVRGS
jgi:glycosyltransferase involved in cell wall biosynthesis